MIVFRISLALAFTLFVASAGADTGSSTNTAPPPSEPTYNQEGFGLPALFVLNYHGAPPDYNGRRVRMLAGDTAPSSPLPAQDVWYILPGTVLRSFQTPPRGVRVRLYTGKGVNRRLLCTVRVRYYRVTGGKWRPWYELDSDYNGIWHNNAFKPFNPAIEEQPLVYRIGSLLPNGDGYYPYLKLQSSVGPLSINSWNVSQER